VVLVVLVAHTIVIFSRCLALSLFNKHTHTPTNTHARTYKHINTYTPTHVHTHTHSHSFPQYTHSHAHTHAHTHSHLQTHATRTHAYIRTKRDIDCHNIICKNFVFVGFVHVEAQRLTRSHQRCSMRIACSLNFISKNVLIVNKTVN